MEVKDFFDSSIFVVLFFIICVLLSVLLNKLFLNFATNLGIRNHDEKIIRWSSTSKPALGGISFYIVFLIASLCYNLIFGGGAVFFNKEFIGIFGATGVAFLMGLSDDAYNTNPVLKLSAQILCSIILISTGTYISIFDQDWLNYGVTVFWVVGIMNSINMLDNMDGITSITSVFVLLSALLTFYLHEDYSQIHLMVVIGVLGSLIGFLYFNWHPSKMFMGDTGSQFLGIFLASVGIIYFWNNKGISGEEIPSKQIVITILAFMIPLIDTTTVTINRLAKGQSPMIGGKDHTTHHLSYLGLRDNQVGFIFAGLSLISFILIFVLIRYVKEWDYVYVGLSLLYPALVFTVLFGCTKLRRAKKESIVREREASAETKMRVEKRA